MHYTCVLILKWVQWLILVSVPVTKLFIYTSMTHEKLIISYNNAGMYVIMFKRWWILRFIHSLFLVLRTSEDAVVASQVQREMMLLDEETRREIADQVNPFTSTLCIYSPFPLCLVLFQISFHPYAVQEMARRLQEQEKQKYILRMKQKELKRARQRLEQEQTRDTSVLLPASGETGRSCPSLILSHDAVYILAVSCYSWVYQCFLQTQALSQ